MIRLLIILVAGLMAVVLLIGAAALFWLLRPLVPANPVGSGAVPAGLEIVVPRGTGAAGVGLLLRDAGLDVEPRAFALTARISGQHTRLKAGVYLLKPGDSLWRVMRTISRGVALQEAVTFIEGWTFQQVLAALHAHPGVRRELSSDPLLAARELSNYLREQGVVLPHVEGWIFPDTYLFDRASTDRMLLSRAVRLQIRVVEAAWQTRSANSTVNSAEELLTLASMVEKETQVEMDRLKVSAVFHNRLRIGMPLQSDPTVIYALGSGFDGNLRRADLKFKSPFNTYVARGLPPHPIANPGRAAILAAANPAVTKDLYFVAMGEGRSYFSRELSRHNHAVNYFQRRIGSPPPPQGSE